MADFGTGHEWLKAIGEALADKPEFGAEWTVVTHANATAAPPSGPTAYLEWVRSAQGAMGSEVGEACAHVVAVFLVWPWGESPDHDDIRAALSVWGQTLLETLNQTPGVPSVSTWRMEYEPGSMVDRQKCSVLEIEIETDIYI